MTSPLLIAPVLTLSGAAHAADGWPDLEDPAPAPHQRPHDVAVIVGIEDYEHLLDFPGAAKTALNWHRWFERGLGLPQSQQWLLLEGEASAQAMAAAITEAAMEVGPKGRLWFVFLGQASPSCTGDDALLFSHDAGPEATEFVQQAFTLSSLLSLLELGGHDDAVLVLDASINERDRSIDKLGCTTMPVMPPIELDGGERGTLLTAARPDEFAGTLLGSGTPAFGHLLLGAVSGWGDLDGDGEISVLEAQEWVRGTLEATQRRMTQTPELWGAGGEQILGTTTQAPPDRATMLFDLARHHQRQRASAIDQAREDLETQAAEAWQEVVRAGAESETVTEWLERYQLAAVQQHGQKRWAVLTHLQAAREAADTPPPAAIPGQDAQAMAAHDQITGEMRHLAKRNAWKGVERAFTDLEALAGSGEHPTLEDLDLGAQAARALGKVDAVHERLVSMATIDPAMPGVLQWLNELEASYGLVKLRDRSGSGATLAAARMPMAPDQRSAIEAAVAQVETQASFEGRLPWGVYTFGERMFVVIPGDRPLEITLRRR